MQLVDIKLRVQLANNSSEDAVTTYQINPHFGCEYGRVQSIHQRSHALFGRDITVRSTWRLFDFLTPGSLARRQRCSLKHILNRHTSPVKAASANGLEALLSRLGIPPPPPAVGVG